MYLILIANKTNKQTKILSCCHAHVQFMCNKWLLGCNSELSVHSQLILYKQVIRPVWSYGIQLWGCTSITISKWFNATKTKYWSVLLTHYGTFEIVTIVISGSRRLQISSLSSASLMKRDLKTTPTLKRPDFSTRTISPDNWSGRNRLN
jgi:hypothetical protein